MQTIGSLLSWLGLSLTVGAILGIITFEGVKAYRVQSQNKAAARQMAEELFSGERMLQKAVELDATSKERRISLTWNVGDNIYVTGSLPTEKVRVRFAEDAAVPRVRFFWGPLDSPYALHTRQNSQGFLDRFVTHAEIFCREGSCPLGP